MAIRSENATGPFWKILGIALVLGISYLFFATLRPFFSALAWAGILAYGLYPLYRYLCRMLGGRRGLSALFMCVGLTVGLILPILSLSLLIGEEVIHTYKRLIVLIQERKTSSGGGWQDFPLISTFLALLEKFEHLTGTNLWTVISDNLAQGSRFLVQQLSYFAGNVLVGLLQLGLILLSTFFLFRDGAFFVSWIQKTLPVPLARQQIMIHRFEEVVVGTIYGNSLVAVLEGLIGGCTFWGLGIPSPVLWGTVMGALAFLPLFGASLVWVPGVFYLLYLGAYGKMIALVLVGISIALMDYVVRTIVIGNKSKLHTLLVFLSVLGGLQVFGFVGIVAGPLVIAISIAILETYQSEKTGQTDTLSPAPSPNTLGIQQR